MGGEGGGALTIHQEESRGVSGIHSAPHLCHVTGDTYRLPYNDQSGSPKHSEDRLWRYKSKGNLLRTRQARHLCNCFWPAMTMEHRYFSGSITCGSLVVHNSHCLDLFLRVGLQNSAPLSASLQSYIYVTPALSALRPGPCLQKVGGGGLFINSGTTARRLDLH